MNRGTIVALLLVAPLLSTLLACNVGPDEPETTVSSCDVPLDQLVFGGVGRDGIVALTDPTLIAADDPASEYVGDSTRVVGLRLGSDGDGDLVRVRFSTANFFDLIGVSAASGRTFAAEDALDRGGRADVVAIVGLLTS